MGTYNAKIRKEMGNHNAGAKTQKKKKTEKSEVDKVIEAEIMEDLEEVPPLPLSFGAPWTYFQ